MDDWSAIAEIAAKVQAGELKAVDLVNKSLTAIETNKDFDAIISIPKDRALERAVQIDKAPKGRLAGVPFVSKDNFLTLSGKTTAASYILKPFEAPYQATAIEKLEAEGAICVAKANLDAFAHGASTENSDFFTTKNPFDKNRVPGGSSGGSAASVALRIAPFAIGTDTGGSIRQPASFCGVVGYKPTYGLVSRSGVVAMASSTDVIGPLARSVADAALVLDVMSGPDGLDSTMVERQKDGYDNLESQISGKKIGVIKQYMDSQLDDSVKQVIEASIEKFKQAGAEITEVDLPSIGLALAVYYIICPAEVSSNLARYDGQRFGHSAAEAQDLLQSYELSREQGFGAEAKRRIMIGTHVLSSGYYDAYYQKAQTVRTKLINEFNEAFKNVDFLVGPNVRWDVQMNGCFYEVDSEEASWNSGTIMDNGNLGHRPRVKGGYFPVPPVDSYHDLRSAMCHALMTMGLVPEVHHHEVATCGQNEITTRYSTLLHKCDEMLVFKYVIQNVANAHNKTVTFMPKPLVGDNGSGLHCHQSLGKNGKNLFVGKEYAGLSEMALYYIGGIIKHARALNAFTNPSTNSYKRLVPGFEAPVTMVYSEGNRSAGIRIPRVFNDKEKRIEVRFPDAMANPYLAFPAMLMAGLDGIKNKIHPGKAVDENLYDLPEKKVKSFPSLASSLEQALDCLEKDQAFLLEGGVFTKELIESYIAIKREEVTRINMTTHPAEFDLYYSL